MPDYKPLLRQNIFMFPEAAPSCTLPVATNCLPSRCHSLPPRHSNIFYSVFMVFNLDKFVTCRIARTAGWSPFGTVGLINATYLKIDVIRFYRISTDVLFLCFTLTSRSDSQQTDACLWRCNPKCSFLVTLYKVRAGLNGFFV